MPIGDCAMTNELREPSSLNFGALQPAHRKPGTWRTSASAPTPYYRRQDSIRSPRGVDKPSIRVQSSQRWQGCAESCVYVQFCMAASLRTTRCPAAQDRFGRVTKHAVVPKSTRTDQGRSALQTTIFLEECVQIECRAVRLRNFRGGDDLGGPFARKADKIRRCSPSHSPTLFLRSGVRGYLCAGSRLKASDNVAVFHTAYGAFDGNSWEHLCQLVFKRKFADDGYTQIPATPGDYGLEGFTKTTGCGYQCYCPDKVYPARELYEKQRDKITADLKKLQTNETELTEVLGTTKLRRWHLVTPTISHNNLIKHAQAKEAEVREWNLSILTPDFQVLVHDADHYATEIQELKLAVGQALDFGGLPAVLPALNDSAETYEKNIMRKTRTRLAKASAEKLEDRVARLYAKTLREFLGHGARLKLINDKAPTVHSRLARLINGYEAEVGERCFTWEGTPQELTDKIRDGLTARIVRELAPAIGETDAADIARMIVARWIAVCEVDYD